MWKDTLRKIYYESEADKRVSNITVFIESLLKQQREIYYYHIENSIGTKEADYIDKMVNGKEN